MCVCKSWAAALRGQQLHSLLLGGWAGDVPPAKHAWVVKSRPAAAMVRATGWLDASNEEKQEVLSSLQPEVSQVVGARPMHVEAIGSADAIFGPMRNVVRLPMACTAGLLRSMCPYLQGPAEHITCI